MCVCVYVYVCMCVEFTLDAYSPEMGPHDRLTAAMLQVTRHVCVCMCVCVYTYVYFPFYKCWHIILYWDWNMEE